MRKLSALALLLTLTASINAEEKKASKEKILPDFKLTAVTLEKTTTVTKEDFAKDVWIANFAFTRCNGPCPLNSARMSSLQKKLPASVKLVTFSIDPTFDQEEALKKYAKRFKADPKRWMFITAPDEETMIPLFKDGFGTAFRENKSMACGYETYHSEKFFLIGPGAVIKGEYNLKSKEEMLRLKEDAAKLAKS